MTALGTGGTIASTADEDGATPELTTEELLEAVPDVERYANVRAKQVAQTPSFDMDFGTLDAVRRAVRDATEGGADGVVIPHGTDTMEDSAYYLDSTLDVDAPVVLTGAQRRPDELGADGPANLSTAVRVASHDVFRGAGGVYVAFDEEVHAARDVTKVHTSRLDAFASPGKGPVATEDRREVRVHREPGSRSPTVATGPPSASVPTVQSGVGVDGRVIEWAVEDGVEGLVVEGTGLGNTTAAIGEAIADAVAEGVPVVVTSRCVAGATASVYGTPGGGETLRERGAIHAGDLTTGKTRIKLLLVLEETTDPDEIRRHFETG